MELVPMLFRGYAMANQIDMNITDPKRVRNFATFFKNYMSLSSVVVAALPIPITSFGVIPVFQVDKALLSALTTMFCFLELGFVFYVRHVLARLMFPGVYRRSNPKASRYSLAQEIRTSIVAALPFLLIAMSFALFVTYVETHSLSASVLADISLAQEPESWEIQNHGRLIVLYIGAFCAAEGAFILMAVKEYLQDLLTRRPLRRVLGDHLGLQRQAFGEVQSIVVAAGDDGPVGVR